MAKNRKERENNSGEPRPSSEGSLRPGEFVETDENVGGDDAPENNALRARRHKGVFGYFLRNLNKKHRISVRDQYDDREVSYVYMSSAKMIFAFLGLVVVLFAGVFVLVIYTPLIDMIPGYPGKKSRQLLVDNIHRLDSLDNEIRILQAYTHNVSLIMDGKTPLPGSSQYKQDSVAGRAMLAPDATDSLIRNELETTGRYALLHTPPPPKLRHLESMQFRQPVRGEISVPFSPRKGMLGVGISLQGSQQVVAAQDGSVVMNLWSPYDGYVIQLLHSDGFITVYKNTSRLLKSAGEKVQAGEAIAYVDAAALKKTGEPFVFELWYEGQPVDPEKHIRF